MHRGVILPEDMTPQCLDEMATLFVDSADDLLEKDSDLATAADAGVMAFQVVRLRCPQKVRPPER